MKRLYIFLLMMLSLSLASDAQSLRFGYFSYDKVFKSSPEYTSIQNKMKELTAKYDAETKRAEDEFNSKYEDFLAGQREFAPSILKKRQMELQELMEKNIEFKKESERLLRQAENEAYIPLKEKLNNLLQRIGKERGYAFILNTDDNACPYTDDAMGDNITELLIERLR